MTQSVLAELESLRTMLEFSPQKYAPFQPLSTPAPPALSSHQKLSTSHVHNGTMKSAERSVDRLGRAIEAAEEEMEAALRRTTEVHKSQLRQKEVELSEALRLLAAKEQSIDSLRDTLATTKRTYEARLTQVESSLSLQESQVSSLRQELSSALHERDNLHNQLSKSVSSQGRDSALLRQRETELTAERRAREAEVAAERRAREVEVMAERRARAEEASRSTLTLQGERQELVRAQEEAGRAHQECSEVRRQVDLLGEELRVMQIESRNDKNRYNAELEELRRRLRHEHGLRKACEKWLRSELRSRDEMEVLLSAIKDNAHDRTSSSVITSASAAAAASAMAADAQDIELLLAGLRHSPRRSGPETRSPQSPTRVATYSKGGKGRQTREEEGGVSNASAAKYTPHQQVVELELVNQQVHRDNRRLKAELTAAKKLLAERISSRG